METLKKRMEGSTQAEMPATGTRATSTERRYPGRLGNIILPCIMMTVVFLSFCCPGVSSAPEAEQRAKTARTKLYEQSVKYSKPLNILLIGAPGVGKSSFINSAIRAITKKSGWWSTVGTSTYKGKITFGLHRYNLYFPDLGNNLIIQEGETIKAPDGGPITSKQAPNIIDVCGLPDENNPFLVMVLRLLFYGHFNIDDNILDVLKYAGKKTPLELLDFYPEGDKDMAIHRVVVVVNADGDVPWELLQAVMEAARPTSYKSDGKCDMYKRAVPVFGLMTKLDKVQQPDGSISKKAIERKNDLIEALELQDGRFGLCKNYVSIEDEEMTGNDPEMDEKILKFLSTVVNPHQKIINDDWKLKSGLWTKIRQTFGFC